MPDKKKAPMSRVNMSLPADLKKAAQAYALQRGINLQDLVAEALLQVVPRKVTVRIIESSLFSEDGQPQPKERGRP